MIAHSIARLALWLIAVALMAGCIGAEEAEEWPAEIGMDCPPHDRDYRVDDGRAERVAVRFHSAAVEMSPNATLAFRLPVEACPAKDGLTLQVSCVSEDVSIVVACGPARFDPKARNGSVDVFLETNAMLPIGHYRVELVTNVEPVIRGIVYVMVGVTCNPSLKPYPNDPRTPCPDVFIEGEHLTMASNERRIVEIEVRDTAPSEARELILACEPRADVNLTIECPDSIMMAAGQDVATFQAIIGTGNIDPGRSWTSFRIHERTGHFQLVVNIE